LGNPEAKMPLLRNLNDMGLQDAVRSLFRRSYPIYLLPTDIRDTLVSAGTFGPPSKNLLISAHGGFLNQGRAGSRVSTWRETGLSLENSGSCGLSPAEKSRKPKALRQGAVLAKLRTLVFETQ